MRFFPFRLRLLWSIVSRLVFGWLLFAGCVARGLIVGGIFADTVVSDGVPADTFLGANLAASRVGTPSLFTRRDLRIGRGACGPFISRLLGFLADGLVGGSFSTDGAVTGCRLINDFVVHADRRVRQHACRSMAQESRVVRK